MGLRVVYHSRNAVVLVALSEPLATLQNWKCSMKRLTALLLVIAFSSEVLLAVDGKKAAYMGGTFSAYTSSKGPVEGKLDSSLTDVLLLTPDEKDFRGTVLTIPYVQVLDLEYGQKAGRRVGAAIG